MQKSVWGILIIVSLRYYFSALIFEIYLVRQSLYVLKNARIIIL